MAGTIKDYIGSGTLASRPVSPGITAVSGGSAHYYATDNNTLYCWDGAAWQPVQTATTMAIAQQSTATSISSGSYAKMQLDGPSILRGGATVDNTGMTGNGLKPGVAGTYLIVAEVSSALNVGTFLQVGWGLNGTLQHLTMGSSGQAQNGGSCIDVAALSATDVVNCMAQAGTAQNSYPAGTRLMVIRLF